MAGIFDNFSTLNLTPAELKALQLRQAGGGLMGTLEGEYLPREDVPQGSRPALGSDPVSTQQQSGTNPDAKSRTFYGGRDGAPVSTDPEDVRRKPSAASRWTPDGSAHPEAAKASGVDWKPPAEGRAAMAVADEVGTLAKFGRVAGKALGPVGVLMDFANPEAVADGELTPEQQQEMAKGAVANMGQQTASDAVAFAGGVADRAVGKAMGRPGVDLRDPNAPQANLFDQSQSPRQELPQEVQQAALAQPATVDTPVGQAAPAQPVNPEQQVAAQTAQQETVRQATEQASVQALTSGELTRPKAAEAVVKADAKRAGVELTPEQSKKAVQEELTNMKSMDNSQLGKYLSYAAIAGGLIASFMDKSGAAGAAFAGSFNKQLDRNMTTGMANQKAAAAKAKFEAEQKLERDKLQRTDRGLDIREKGVDQQGEYQDAQVGLGQERNEISRDGQESTNAYRGASLGLRQQAMAQRQQEAARDQQNWEKMFGFKESEAARDAQNDNRTLDQGDARVRQGNEKNLIAAKKAAATSEGKGIDVTTKDAEATVKATAESQGVKLDKAALANAAQQYRARVKNDPKAAQGNSAGIINGILNGESFQSTPGKKGLIWDDAGSIKLK